MITTLPHNFLASGALQCKAFSRMVSAPPSIGVCRALLRGINQSYVEMFEEAKMDLYPASGTETRICLA